MRILIIFNGVLPVFYYGGTQRVVWYLTKELNDLGHKVTLMCYEGSKCEFADIKFYDKDKPIVSQINQDNYDVVHFHYLPGQIEGLKIPYVITLHGNVFKKTKLDENTIFISKDHANNYGSQSYVYNGLDWSNYGQPELNITKINNYFHFLGKAKWRLKNVKGAIETFNKSNVDDSFYILGGKRFKSKLPLKYSFNFNLSFKGMVGGEVKNHYLRFSKGLIFPVLWNEPFGLAVIESLYFGAPVFSTPYGSLKELVIPEVGFTSSNSNELAKAINNFKDYDRKLCHEYAQDCFNSLKMAKNYLLFYDKVMNGKKVNETAPCLVNDKPIYKWT